MGKSGHSHAGVAERRPEAGGFVERDTQTFASTFTYATVDDNTDSSRAALANPQGKG